MALTKCKECDHDVSTTARVCPNCGAPDFLSDDGKELLGREQQKEQLKKMLEEKKPDTWSQSKREERIQKSAGAKTNRPRTTRYLFVILCIVVFIMVIKLWPYIDNTLTPLPADSRTAEVKPKAKEREVAIPESKPVTANWQTPSVAIGYLATEGLPTRGYKYESGNTYYATSPYKEIGSGFPIANNIAYYVDGSRNKVKKLELVLNVNVREKSSEAHARLLRYSEILCQKALSEKLPPEMSTAITNGVSRQWDLQNVRCELIRADWGTGKGYELRFSIVSV